MKPEEPWVLVVFPDARLLRGVVVDGGLSVAQRNLCATLWYEQTMRTLFGQQQQASRIARPGLVLPHRGNGG